MIYGERNNYELSQMYLVNVKAQSRRASHRQALWKKFAAHRPFVNRRCPRQPTKTLSLFNLDPTLRLRARSAIVINYSFLPWFSRSMDNVQNARSDHLP